MTLRPGSRVVVTGVNGFVGPHVVAALQAHDLAVVGIGREPACEVAGIDDYVVADLAAGWPAVDGLTAVVHLAGLSAVGPSFAAPQPYLELNSRMVTHLAEGLLAAGSSARLVVVSSGAVYDAAQDQPLTETSRVGHSSPYVLSKLLVEAQAAYYAGRGLDVVVARPFNHLGPGQASGFLLPDLADALDAADVTEGPARVGALDTRRDYTDVRDVARAYALLVTAPRLDDRLFNVCSGVSTSGRELLGLLAAATGRSDVRTVVDPDRIRPGDPAEVRGSAGRLRDAVGWQPRITLPTTVADYLAARGRR